MSATQSIESQDITVGKLFDDYYVVPNYQREYVWERDQVEQLLEDIYTEFSSDERSAEAEYFIGSIVVCTQKQRLYELIDGQQRLTTIFLFLCAVRDYLDELGERPIDSLNKRIKSVDIDDQGNDVVRYRLVLQYEDSKDILKEVAERNHANVPHSQETRSIRNISQAYENIGSLLRTYFGNDYRRLRKFFSFFVHNVKLIRIRTRSVTHALKIFETINDRGKGLDSMDLLKNLMFIQSNPREFNRLKRMWKEMVDSLYRSNEKPLRFLRYYVLATYQTDRLKEQDIYEWFSKHADECGYRDSPLEFVTSLVEAANAYSNFISGCDVLGQPNRYLSNIQKLSGTARQHLVLLLAARGLPSDLFNDLCRQVENLFFIHIITRENTREFERRFAQWANELRAVRTQAELQDFLNRQFEPSKAALSQRFDLSFEELSADRIQKYRMRYLLG